MGWLCGAAASSRDEGSLYEHEQERWPPASAGAVLFAAGWIATLTLIAVAINDDSRSDEPPSGRPLPDSALAAEQPARRTPRPLRHRAPRLVDVIDRDAPPPRRIDIPAIGVSAAVVPLRLNDDGTMQTPRHSSDAGWYEPGREPGERGPAVIAGHVDSTSGPAVFYRLRELRRGDLIRIRRADRSVVRFHVEGLERWPKAAFPTRRVFGKTRLSALRLVTCSGDFDASIGHYTDNTIVYAARLPGYGVAR